MLDIGLSYKQNKPNACDKNISRLDQIRDHLISLHALLKLNKEGKAVSIYLDESYCTTNHSDMQSLHLSTGKPVRNKSTSRGRRLIFIHAIMKYGPPWNFDVIKGRPIEKIKRKGDTPNIDSMDIKTINKDAGPLPLTSKLFWISDLHTWDYHDNMNGEMFMKWMTNKFIPLTPRNYYDVQMIPYHYVVGIPSLQTIGTYTLIMNTSPPTPQKQSHQLTLL